MATTRLLSAMVATWNNVAVTFTGMKLNVTDTASASASLLMDLQVGGTSRFSVNKYGRVVIGDDLQANSAVLVTNNAGLIRLGASSDVVLARDAANTLALRNGTAAQAFNVYNTYTDASNYERGELKFDSGFLRLQSTALGTGTQRGMLLNGSEIYFQIAGNNIWRISSAGHFVAVTDNTYDIGAVGANRPRNVYVGDSLVFGNVGVVQAAGRSVWRAPSDGVWRATNAAGTNSVDFTVGASNLLTLNGGLTTGAQITSGGSVIAGGNVLAGSVQALGWIFKSLMYSATDGNITLYNNAGTAFSLLQFGGTTSSFPAIKRSATNLEARLADDSAFASVAMKDITTSNTTFLHATSASLANGAAAQVATMTNGPTAGNPTKWIAINDNGVTRYIPCW